MNTLKSYYLKKCILLIFYYVQQHVVSVESFGPKVSTKFSTLVLTSAYVDKTLLIKELLEHNKTAVISAPPKFGKSTNLEMIRTFLEIEVDKNGRSESRLDYLVGPVTDTNNYRLFDDSNLKIKQHANIMNEYCGRTPVLSVSFKCDYTLRNLDEVVYFFKQVVHQTFKNYQFLLKSDKLSTMHKQYIDNWCNDRDYRMFGRHSVSAALRCLAEYLFRHFGERRVFVLVDDHDSVIKAAMFSVKNDDVLKDIIKYSMSILNSVLKNSSRYVRGSLVTGVSDIPEFGSPAHNIDDPDSIQVYRFLGDHKFVDFYGITSQEVEKLFMRTKITLFDNLLNQVTAKYGGYTSLNGREIYNLFSVMSYIKTRKFDVYWPNSCSIRNISDVVKIPFINECLDKLMNSGSINVTVIDTVTPDFIVQLRNYFVDPNVKNPFLDKEYLFFLVESGYLSYTSGAPGAANVDSEVFVKIPNEEIKEYFDGILKR